MGFKNKAPAQLGIVTPSLGTSEFFKDTVRSIERVAGQIDLKHVIVCPQNRIPQMQQLGPNAVVMAQEPAVHGMYAAINQGMAQCQDCDWLTYLNDDDLLSDGFITMMQKPSAGGGQRIIKYGEVEIIDHHGILLGRHPICRNPRYLKTLWQIGISANAQPGTIFSQEAFGELGGFDASLKHCGDAAFWIKAMHLGFIWEYFPGTVACFRVHPSQISARRNEVEDEINRVRSRYCSTRIPVRDQLFAKIHFRLANAGTYLKRSWQGGIIRFSDYYKGAQFKVEDNH